MACACSRNKNNSAKRSIVRPSAPKRNGNIVRSSVRNGARRIIRRQLK